MGHLAAANCNANLSFWTKYGIIAAGKSGLVSIRVCHVDKLDKVKSVEKGCEGTHWKSVEKGKECEEARWEGASCNWTRSLHICHRRKLLREGIFQTYFSEQEYLLSTFNSFRSLTPISSRFWSNNLIHIIMIWHFNLKRGRNRINMVKK